MKRLLTASFMLAAGFTLAQSAPQAPADSLAPKPKPAPVAPTPVPAPEKNELKYNLNESGTHFFKATFLNQTWLRLNQSNPGTTVIQEPNTQSLDIGLRRTRMQLYGQINDRVLLYFQFGMNNFNYLNGFPGFNTAGTPSNRKVGAFFHDAVGEYLVVKNRDYLKIGGGLTIVNGLSRFSQPGISSIMTMDVPVFAQATVDQTDEFSRKLTVYARGQIGRIDYRIAMSDPFPIQTNGAAPPALSAYSSFALKGHKKQFQGLFLYQFFDKEANQTPGYMTGTYLGKKKILNLEAGFITQQNATWHRENTADTVYQAMNLWSVASFLDMPLDRKKGTAINAYLGYFHTDYGQNYLRYNGIMNPASGSTITLPGASNIQGNAFPMFGTGSVVYSQVGYLFPADMFGKGNGTLMPYAQLQVSNYERLTKPMSVWNLGLNWLVRGHNSKFSLDYQSRPTFESAGGSSATPQLRQNGRKGQLVLQYQVFI